MKKLAETQQQQSFFAALASDPDDVLCITPSDHWINDEHLLL
ncbi:MAG: hypothetical protein ACJ0A5_03160 [Candidatus Puniceispirillales bacterium]